LNTTPDWACLPCRTSSNRWQPILRSGDFQTSSADPNDQSGLCGRRCSRCPGCHWRSGARGRKCFRGSSCWTGGFWNRCAAGLGRCCRRSCRRPGSRGRWVFEVLFFVK
jgi:hypothetical protein